MKAYTLERCGDGWLLVGPACPREDGYYRIGLAAAQAETKLLSEVHEAAQCERAAELARLRAYALLDACCPCCEQNRDCLGGCTFAQDDPSGHQRMTAARFALRGEKEAKP